ncbi:Phosphate regulon transcriptional regulatory protein PhoB [Pseudobythopirellula maris]|uniref:Phosphate regulon transcriptional regulatory protein PhoB n=1 Tax=Pseudobythopirellula maris TaxID=2527991 RepID=A0A5C5ZUN8_9BACT|nr:response regulator [Pseudobythopirellula maris]TWT89913.1 Phosphate regulon transcriptional regulatory protein PhoB [Pseudobythopirellula maris]
MGEAKQILLVEEDPTLREITAFRLELLGYVVESRGSAEEALLAIQEGLPDAVVVGHYLPDIDGMELIDRLSNDLRTGDVPVMMLSPNAELDDVQRAFNAGADDYLVVPFDPIVLEQKLLRLTSTTA